MKKIGLTLIFILLFIFQLPAQSFLKGDKIPKDLVIHLERTTCFGSCPDYKLIIKVNGLVKFTGGRFAKTRGKANGIITLSQVKQLINEFETADFFALQNSYSCLIDDSPSEIISIKLKGKTKTVEHRFGCKVEGDDLERIINLGKKIDEIANSKRWIGERK